MKIVSGGQTGVDRAALDAALEYGVEAGGWCPEGRKAEDGVIPAKYPVQELPQAGPRQRTKKMSWTAMEPLLSILSIQSEVPRKQFFSA